jgi:hypothetical protein
VLGLQSCITVPVSIALFSFPVAQLVFSICRNNRICFPIKKNSSISFALVLPIQFPILVLWFTASVIFQPYYFHLFFFSLKWRRASQIYFPFALGFWRM